MTKQGRPPRGKKAATKQIAIRVSDAEYKRYLFVARHLESTVSDMVRQLLEHEYQRLRELFV